MPQSGIQAEKQPAGDPEPDIGGLFLAAAHLSKAGALLDRHKELGIPAAYVEMAAHMVRTTIRQRTAG